MKLEIASICVRASKMSMNKWVGVSLMYVFVYYAARWKCSRLKFIVL